MEASIIVAGLAAWSTVVAGYLDLRARTNGHGPIAERVKAVEGGVSKLHDESLRQGAMLDVLLATGTRRDARQDARDRREPLPGRPE